MVKNILKEDFRVLRRLLRQLTPRERKIICTRFGFSLGVPKTLEATGQEFAITRERVRQLQERAIGKMDLYFERMLEEELKKLKGRKELKAITKGAMKLLKGKDYSTDLSRLAKLLDKAKVSYVLGKHPAAREKDIKELIGYFPTGEWQILINKELSIIRGMVSFGDIEIMRIGGKGEFIEPERFDNEQEALEAILKEIKE